MSAHRNPFPVLTPSRTGWASGPVGFPKPLVDVGLSKFK